MSEKIDTLKEKIELYLEVKRRIELLKNLEKQSGLPMPETRELIALAAQLLEKIRDEMQGRMSAEDVKRSVFKEWLEKKEES
jgi:uncharacterized protein YnzC (UPF0291/DUF896 family)